MKILNMTKNHNAVATEPQVCRIPAFHVNEAPGFSPSRECTCPHVLVADDDNFQHLYYQNLFQRSLDFSELPISRDNLRVKMCFSGEELLEELKDILQCGCSKLMLIITDYSMGNTKLDGINTASKVREAGYEGQVLLRTSETVEFLKSKHLNLDKIVGTRIIDELVSKADFQQGKEVIQDFLKTG